MKKWIAILLLIGLCVGLTACGPTSDGQSGRTDGGETNPAQTVGQVRILNNDPQLQTAWETLAAEYKDLTGVEVLVISSDSESVPTLLEITDESQLPKNAVDLSSTGAYAQLDSWDLALRDDQGKVCAVAAEAEVFGLVYNSTLLARTSNTRADIDSFGDLTEVVYAITDGALELGFSAFPRLTAQEEFALLLAALNGDARNLVDLIINNTAEDPMIIAQTTGEEALQDFLDGKAVFFLAGSMEHDTLSAIGSENMGVLPVYLGVENEENKTLCTAARSYWCVDGGASALDIQETLAFLNYLVQPRADGTVPVDDLGLMAPYRQAKHICNMLEAVFRSDVDRGMEPMVCRYVSQVPEGLPQALIAYVENPSNDNWEKVSALMG